MHFPQKCCQSFENLTYIPGIYYLLDHNTILYVLILEKIKITSSLLKCLYSRENLKISAQLDRVSFSFENHLDKIIGKLIYSQIIVGLYPIFNKNFCPIVN